MEDDYDKVLDLSKQRRAQRGTNRGHYEATAAATIHWKSRYYAKVSR